MTIRPGGGAGGSGGSSVAQYVNHGSVAGTTRPAGAGMVIWIGDVQPTNLAGIDIWVSGAAVSTAPGAPTGLAATSGHLQVALTWVAPTANGGQAITDYVVQYKATSSGTWLTFADGTSTSTAATVTSLTDGTSYDFRVAAVNSVGQGSYSSTVSATPALVAGSTLAADNFNRADATSGLGATSTGALTWAVNSGEGIFGISSNQGYLATVNNPARTDVDVATGNVDISVDVTLNGGNIGLCYRSADFNNYWRFTVRSDAWFVVKNVGGTATQLATATVATSNSTPVTIRVTVTSGGVHTCYIGGTQVATFTDNALASNTKVGLFSLAGNTSARWDNFSALAA